MGSGIIHKALPDTSTVVMIGFNLAPVVARTYWPRDLVDRRDVHLVIVICLSVGLRGFAGRIAIFLSLIIGYVLSWLADLTLGPKSTIASSGTVEAFRVDWTKVANADWFGLPPVTDLAIASGSWVALQQ